MSLCTVLVYCFGHFISWTIKSLIASHHKDIVIFSFEWLYFCFFIIFHGHWRNITTHEMWPEPKRLFLIKVSGIFWAYAPSLSLSLSLSLSFSLSLSLSLYIYIYIYIYTSASCAQSHLIPCNRIDCNPPGSFVHGIFWARILKWVAMPSSRGSSWLRDWNYVSSDSSTGK